MKTFFLLLLTATTSVSAKFLPATVKFNDGHSETGMVKSFLENRFIDVSQFTKLEKALNLNDNSLKFKVSEDSQVRTIAIDEIDEVTIHYKDSDEHYKVLYLRSVNLDGLTEAKFKMFFPLLRRGKVNLYGFEYIERIPSAFGATDVERNIMYYYQNEKDNFAVDPWAKTTMATALRGDNYKIFDVFLAEIFKDCPEFVAELQQKNQARSTREGRKIEFQETKRRLKELKGSGLSKLQYNFETVQYFMADALKQYPERCK